MGLPRPLCGRKVIKRDVAVLINGLQGPSHSAARGKRRHQGDEYYLQNDRQIAGYANREIAKQGRDLIPFWRAPKPSICRFYEPEQQNCGAAANGASLKPKHEKVALKLAGNEIVGSAYVMQYFDDRAIGRHGAARGEGD